MAGEAPVWLTAERIAALGIGAAELREALAEGLRRAGGPGWNAAKSAVADVRGNGFMALPALVPGEPFACVKWVCALADPPPGGPSVRGTILLSSTRDGRLVAALDAEWITGARTAAMSALAALALARPDPRRAGFIGGGVQARSHLDAILAAFPGLEAVTVHARSAATMADFRAHAEARGLRAEASAGPEGALEGQDIVISTVPAAGMAEPFLDPAGLAPHAFVAMVDLGRSWRQEGFAEFTSVATDDPVQSAQLAAQGKLAFPGPYAHDLRDLARAAPGVLHPEGRSAFVFSGIGLCDAIAAHLVAERAGAL